MVELFLKYVLCADETIAGAYGNVSSYYGAVEQQGRLTLHLHLIAWICNALSPQEIWDCIIGEDSEFQRQLFAYLEASHTGDYLTGSSIDVIQNCHKDMMEPTYEDPTEHLPQPPPSLCKCKEESCVKCAQVDSWWSYFRQTVDTLVNMINVHSCCKGNKWGKCRGRFPCALYPETCVEVETGHINLRKCEAWINTFTPLLTYLMRCNTNVSSLCSGTAIKAILIYVSDYITKPALKTHVFFDVIKSVFQRNK
ncbi:hypothetical protein EDD85DRAFT_778027, partial [Armillaria nabsnona]